MHCKYKGQKQIHERLAKEKEINKNNSLIARQSRLERSYS